MKDLFLYGYAVVSIFEDYAPTVRVYKTFEEAREKFKELKYMPIKEVWLIDADGKGILYRLNSPTNPPPVRTFST